MADVHSVELVLDAALVAERNRLAEQGVRDRELIQQLTTQRDDLRALVREMVKEIDKTEQRVENNVGIVPWFAAWRARARALLKDGAN